MHKKRIFVFSFLACFSGKTHSQELQLSFGLNCYQSLYYSSDLIPKTEKMYDCYFAEIGIHHWKKKKVKNPDRPYRPEFSIGLMKIRSDFFNSISHRDNSNNTYYHLERTVAYLHIPFIHIRPNHFPMEISSGFGAIYNVQNKSYGYYQSSSYRFGYHSDYYAFTDKADYWVVDFNVSWYFQFNPKSAIEILFQSKTAAFLNSSLLKGTLPSTFLQS